MRSQLANVLYGLLDYAAYPAGMLVAAPILLHNLGSGGYGLWAVISAAISMGSIIAAGFGDANIREVARHRGAGEHVRLVQTVRSLLGLNLVLGTAVAFPVLVFAAPIARTLASERQATHAVCVSALRVAALLMWMRAIESVCISTQRAFERYGAAVKISIAARLVSLGAAVLLTYRWRSVAVLFGATAAFSAIALAVQLCHVSALLKINSLWPSFNREASAALLGFGAFSWVQAAAGVAFGQLDKVLLGVSVGAASVAGYALCAQIAQPVYGLTASGLHFLFPYLASRGASQSLSQLRAPIWRACVANILFVGCFSAAVIAYGPALLQWIGRGANLAGAENLLAPVVWSCALLALNVSPTYALFAFGRVKTVMWANLAGAGLTAAIMFLLVPRLGSQGVALARFAYGAITIFLYLPLANILLAGSRSENLAARLTAAVREL